MVYLGIASASGFSHEFVPFFLLGLLNLAVVCVAFSNDRWSRCYCVFAMMYSFGFALFGCCCVEERGPILHHVVDTSCATSFLLSYNCCISNKIREDMCPVTRSTWNNQP